MHTINIWPVENILLYLQNAKQTNGTIWTPPVVAGTMMLCVVLTILYLELIERVYRVVERKVRERRIKRIREARVSEVCIDILSFREMHDEYLAKMKESEKEGKEDEWD